MPGMRRTARRTARRTSRRTTRRVMRRRMRRRIIVGGAVMVTAGAAAYGAYKLSQKDVQRIEEHTGASIEELEDDELSGAMADLGIESQPLSEEDKAALAAQNQQPAGVESQAPAPQQPAPQEDYLSQLEKLADLRDRGILTEEEFAAKKKEILGL